MMKSLVFGCAVAGFMTGSAALAQNQDDPPVIKDIPITQTLPKDGIFDVRGVGLGMTYSEVETLLKTLGPSDRLQRQTSNYQIKDNRGNAAGFKYKQSLSTSSFDGAEDSNESISVYFTTGHNEVRAHRIVRHLMYNKDATRANTKDLIKSLKAKYGDPSYEDLQTYPLKLYYVWFRGKRIAFPENDPRRRRATAGNEGTSEGCLRLDNYGLSYRFEQARSEFLPGCETAIIINVSPVPQNRDLIYTMQIEMVDKTRFMENAKTTDKWFLDEIEKAAKAQAPRTTPKL